MTTTPDDERRRLGLAITELTDQLGRSPNVSELAAHLGADRDDVIDDLIWGRNMSRQSAEICTGDVPAENLDLLECRLTEFADVQGLPLLLGVLNDQERRIVLLRLAKSLPQSEIARCLGVSPAAVSRILARSLSILRDIPAQRDPRI